MNEDIRFMQMAIAAAKNAEIAGEVPVGAVLVSEKGEILATGQNRVIELSDCTAHAEIEALRNAGKILQNYRLLNTTLYAIMEPCVMCMGALLHARVKKVVFGIFDPKWGACGSIYDFSQNTLFNHKIQIVSGVCETEIKHMLQTFFKAKRTNGLKKLP